VNGTPAPDPAPGTGLEAAAETVADAAAPDAPVPAGAGTSAPPSAEAAPAERGFPGFPAGDPRQLPLSQRPRGLDAAPPPGGGDPELRETLARERPYMRLLIGMVAVIVGGSLLLTFLALLSAAILR
jgi:hypothetical protein